MSPRGLARPVLAKSPFLKHLEKKHAFLFIEHWKEGERPFNWFAEWERLTVELSDVSFATSENVAAKAFGEDEGNYLTLWEVHAIRSSSAIASSIEAIAGRRFVSTS
jgi:hypothetical protein